MELITDRAEYFKQKAIDQQRRIVNYKKSTTLTSEALVWTYRTTNCDVISIITTAVPIHDGTMKDIRIENYEPKRLKPPMAKKSRKDMLQNTPYDVGLSVDLDKKRKKLNHQLHMEKKEFMSKLNVTRMVRTKLENDAARKIQAAYRGFAVRSSVDELHYYASIHKLIRTNIRAYLESSKYTTKSLSDYRVERQKLRNDSAALIQCTFLRYLSRRYCRRRIAEKQLQLRHAAARIIQAIVRGVHARARVHFLQKKRLMTLCIRSALKIQSRWRCTLAKRKVRRRRYKLRLIACRMIQNWYRALYSRRMTAHIKAVMLARKLFRSSQQIQRIVRAFLARRRVNRIRFRSIYKLLFKAVTRIQCMARKFLSKAVLHRRRQEKLEMHAAEEKQRAIESQRKTEQRTAEENRALLEGADLFLQARRGNAVTVEDIFKGLVGGDPHTAAEVEIGTEDSLLTIAAATDNMELLRKAIRWGCDINHHNAHGQSAVMIAAKLNHFVAFQYLLSFHPASHQNSTEFDRPVLDLTDEEIGFLFVAAAANAAIADLSMLQALLAIGFDVNARSNGDGMTAVHAACELGHADAFKLLVKNKARLDCTDELGQTPLHKACSSSLKIVQWILGLDPDFPTYMSDETRRSSILALDVDNKDCVLHAAIAGQSDILEQLEGVLGQTGGVKKDQEYAEQEIGWSPNDINKGLKLVEHGNLYCLRKIFAVGFDSSWPQEETNYTMALHACKIGDLEVIDLLIDSGTDFSCVDSDGRTVMHFAATCTTSSVLPHLLSHAQAAKCNISKQLLLNVDSPSGENPFHYAARSGLEANIDLLATHEIVSKLLGMKNKAGLTPLLLACRLYQEKIIQLYLKLGADATAVDSQEHGCLWHLYHPDRSAIANRRVFCSEYLLLNNESKSRKDRDEEMLRIQNEAQLVITLLKNGCTLYDNYAQSPDEIKALPFKPNSPPVAHEDPTSEPGDIMVQEFSHTLLRLLVPVISPNDAWKLLIAGIRFDDGSLKTFFHLLKCGMFGVISPLDSLSGISAASIGSVSEEVDSRRMSVAKANNIIATLSKSTSMDIVVPPRMGEEMFQDINLVGWTIRLGNVKALQYFVKKGLNVTQRVDFRGQPSLHYIAMYGTAEMVDVVAADKRVRWEQENRRGWTAGMLAAKQGNQKVAKKLFDHKANPRRSLNGKYSAWVLAFARNREKFEKNLQNGRYGDDDELYFNISPDPFHSIWLQ